MVTVTIDGQTVEVEANATLLDAAMAAGIKIPTLCYHPDQKVKANCPHPFRISTPIRVGRPRRKGGPLR